MSAARIAAVVVIVSIATVAAGCGADRAAPNASGARGPVAESTAIFEGIGRGDPFCTAAVRSDGEVVFAAGYGELDGEPVTTETEVDIASTSKQFTGVAIELLEDEGKLAGDDLVGDLVPASRPATSDLTIDELLTHTSGLDDYTDLLPQDLDEPATQAQAVAAIARSEPTGTRGRFQYSNSNYVLLAEVVAAVSGRPLPAFLADEVFGPLDLAMAVEPRGPWTQIGDGSVWTTPTELVRWSRQYWDQTLDGPDLRTVMFDPEVADTEEGGGQTYGAGISRDVDERGHEELFHDGSWDGFETEWIVVPHDRLAAAVTCDEDAELDTDTPAEDLLAIWRDAG